jgi:predicted metal-dependent peptidase
MSESDDPFAALERAAARQGAQERALRALSQARCRLVLGKDARSAFFATLALRLIPEVDWRAQTMATDGKKLHLNPDFVNSLSPDELLGVVAHEVMHNALAHHARRGHRDPRRWGVACDLAVNPLLLDSGFVLPPSRLMPGEGPFAGLARGLSAEEYYALLPDPQGGRPEEPGQGEQDDDQGGGQLPDPGGCGAVKDTGDGSPAEVRQAQADWEVALAQALQVAKQRGELPAGLARLVEEVLQPKVDWRDVLRQFLSQQARNDFSWSRPNRRFVHRGVYLPGMHSEELGEVVLAVDTSGSIGQEELDAFAAEAQAILESYDCSLTVLYHDCQVQHVQRWASSDGPLRLEPVGGGGTSHACVFDWLEQQGQTPTCLIALTDLYTEMPQQPPALPVLWAVVGDNPSVPPFGLRVDVAG